MRPDDATDFDCLLAEAEQAPFSGWDFSWLEGRWREEPPCWSYRERAKARLAGATALLDMGTGGGEFLASLAPLPASAWATEGYAPNVPLARDRLAPLGVRVEAVESESRLPFADGAFDLVLNRHEAFVAAEVRRVLRPGGVFLTQQVGGSHNLALNHLLGVPEPDFADWDLRRAVAEVERAGFRVIDQREEHPATVFYNVGATVYYLRAVPWQIPSFAVEPHRERLRAIQRTIESEGALVVRGHYFLVEATA